MTGAQNLAETPGFAMAGEGPQSASSLRGKAPLSSKNHGASKMRPSLKKPQEEGDPLSNKMTSGLSRSRTSSSVIQRTPQKIIANTHQPPSNAKVQAMMRRQRKQRREMNSSSTPMNKAVGINEHPTALATSGPSQM